MSDTLIQDLNNLIAGMDSGRASVFSVLEAAAVDAALMQQAETMIDRSNEARSRLASKLQNYAALPAYRAPEERRHSLPHVDAPYVDEQIDSIERSAADTARRYAPRQQPRYEDNAGPPPEVRPSVPFPLTRRGPGPALGESMGFYPSLRRAGQT